MNLHKEVLKSKVLLHAMVKRSRAESVKRNLFGSDRLQSETDETKSITETITIMALIVIFCELFGSAGFFSIQDMYYF